jgi:predicted transcriptional regulator
MSGRGNPDSLEETVYQRGELLCAIDEQPRAKPALTAAIDASRSTVDRGIKELREIDCIERRESKYYPTLLGTLSCTRYRRYQSNVGALDEAQAVVSSLPPSTTLSTTFLKDADVHSADPAAPEVALQPSIDLLADAKRLLGLAPVKLSLYIDLLYEHATENDLSAEIIVEEGMFHPLLRTDEQRLHELVADGPLTILATEDILDYALWLMEFPDREVAGATIYEDGGIRGLIINSAPEAVEWARSEYERRHDVAEAVPADELFEK